MSASPPPTILFICTGNIFRSMTAEYALKSILAGGTEAHVHSAGLIEAPHEIVSFVKEYLLGKGIDVSDHQPRKITRAMLEQANLAVAMDLPHQREIFARFGGHIPCSARLLTPGCRLSPT